MEQDELEKIFDELEEDAYNAICHAYDYKIANQIIRRNFERLFGKQNKESVPAETQVKPESEITLRGKKIDVEKLMKFIQKNY